jgi:hypothetical protein
MTPTTKSNNEALLADFVEFCRLHPEYRFWQALRNWSSYQGILATNRLEDALALTPDAKGVVLFDTFYLETGADRLTRFGG